MGSFDNLPISSEVLLERLSSEKGTVPHLPVCRRYAGKSTGGVAAVEVALDDLSDNGRETPVFLL